jgi:hypothetical protein
MVLTYLIGWVDLQVTERPEGLRERYVSKTPSEIEPATFRVVAQCHSQLPYRLSPYSLVKELVNTDKSLRSSSVSVSVAQKISRSQTELINHKAVRTKHCESVCILALVT